MARRLFLERRTYRRNRLQDAARLLPVLGMILFFGPVFISAGEPGGPGLASWGVYLLVTWLGIIALTAAVSRTLVDTVGEADQAEPSPGGGEDHGAPTGDDPLRREDA